MYHRCETSFKNIDCPGPKHLNSNVLVSNWDITKYLNIKQLIQLILNYMYGKCTQKDILKQ